MAESLSRGSFDGRFHKRSDGNNFLFFLLLLLLLRAVGQDGCFLLDDPGLRMDRCRLI